MIIAHIKDGLGNQLFRYAAGRRLAHKHNTELKLEIFNYTSIKLREYLLDSYNIKQNFATPQEAQSIRSLHEDIGTERRAWRFMPEVLNYPDNVYLFGAWEDEKYFADIADIIRQEFTLKNPIGETAQHWKEKILATECSVSVHIRHGDVVYSPYLSKAISHAALPFEYYHNCVDILRRQCKNVCS